MQILQGISAGENLCGDDPAEHLDGADSAEISTAEDVFVTKSMPWMTGIIMEGNLVASLDSLTSS